MDLINSICVVDDDEDINEMYLEKLGEFFMVRTFISAENAVAEIQNGYRPTVILTDLRMPKLSGFQFIKTLSELGLHIPTIVVSSAIDSRDVAIMMERDVFHFFDKPSSLEAIKVAIDDAILQAQKRAESYEDCAAAIVSKKVGNSAA